jgi:hypothetical protein
VALNRERHAGLRLAATAAPYTFAAKTNALPLLGSEFGVAARDFPIVFVGAEGGPFNVAALVGVRDSENLMVDAAGAWAAGCYVPAFVRRYPFLLVKADDSDKLTVCFDEAYPGFNAEQGEAFFDASGEQSAYLQRTLTFLQDYHTEALRTAEFARRVHELGLLVPKDVHVDRPGQARQSLRGVWIVDAGKLRGIDDARVVELYRSGYLAWIEAHLLSLGNLSRLVSRLAPPAGLSSSAPGDPVSTPAQP